MSDVASSLQCSKTIRFKRQAYNERQAEKIRLFDNIESTAAHVDAYTGGTSDANVEKKVIIFAITDDGVVDGIIRRFTLVTTGDVKIQNGTLPISYRKTVQFVDTLVSAYTSSMQSWETTMPAYLKTIVLSDVAIPVLNFAESESVGVRMYERVAICYRTWEDHLMHTALSGDMDSILGDSRSDWDSRFAMRPVIAGDSRAVSFAYVLSNCVVIPAHVLDDQSIEGYYIVCLDNTQLNRLHLLGTSSNIAHATVDKNGKVRLRTVPDNISRILVRDHLEPGLRIAPGTFADVLRMLQSFYSAGSEAEVYKSVDSIAKRGVHISLMFPSVVPNQKLSWREEEMIEMMMRHVPNPTRSEWWVRRVIIYIVNMAHMMNDRIMPTIFKLLRRASEDNHIDAKLASNMRDMVFLNLKRSWADIIAHAGALTLPFLSVNIEEIKQHMSRRWQLATDRASSNHTHLARNQRSSLALILFFLVGNEVIHEGTHITAEAIVQALPFWFTFWPAWDVTGASLLCVWTLNFTKAQVKGAYAHAMLQTQTRCREAFSSAIDPPFDACVMRIDKDITHCFA